MPPVRFIAGTKSPSTPSAYTDAQYKALDGVKQVTPKLKFGAARPEFVNKAMLADGSISDDTAPLLAAAAAAELADRAAFRAFAEAHADAIAKDELSPADKMTLVNLRSAAKHSFVDEVTEHLAQNRFLFIVDVDLIPRIYFQCATVDAEGKLTNPDVELADEPAPTEGQ